MNKKAVIDLGTNTFHLLIVDHLDSHFETLHRERVYVKLGRNGIHHIPEEAFNLGISSLVKFSQSIKEFDVNHVKALGTEMLRKADNGHLFLEMAKELTGLDIEIIDGVTEANYICKGVLSVVPSEYSRVLIMDIGGGSVEFIIAENKEIIHSESFPIGVAVLKNSFHRSEPISIHQRAELNTFIDNKLTSVKNWISKYSPEILIGASGSFEVLSEIKPEKITENYSEIEIQLFDKVFREVVGLNLKDRIAHPDIPEERADLFVVAMLLIKYIVEKLRATKIGVSQYAMKEGVLFTDF